MEVNLSGECKECGGPASVGVFCKFSCFMDYKRKNNEMKGYMVKSGFVEKRPGKWSQRDMI